MAEGKEDKNPVIAILHGIEIRKTNTVSIRYNETAFRELVEQSHITKLSFTKIIILKTSPCQACGCDNVDFKVSLKKTKYDYRIGDNGGTLLKTINGKGHNNPGEDNPS